MTEQLRFGSTGDGLLHSSDEEFLAAVHWRSSRPGVSRDLGETPDLRTIGLCWKQQCPTVSASSLKSSESALRFTSLDRWIERAEPDSLGHLLGAVRRRKSRVSKSCVQKLEDWLTGHAHQLESDAESLLAACELLILHHERLPAELLGRLWRAALAGAIGQGDLFERAAHTDDWQECLADDDRDGRWLQGGLAPWTCGLLFDEIKGAPRLAKMARSVLSLQLLHSTDSDGSPAGDLLLNLPQAVRLWTDALLVAELFDRPLWKGSADTRCGRLLSRVAATLRPDGGSAGAAKQESGLADVCLTLARLSGVDFRKRWGRLIEELASSSTAATGSSGKSSGRNDNPAWQSDDAETACLRTSWSTDASLVTLAHHDESVSMELVVDGTSILRGPWGIELAEDGDLVEFEAMWECVCFHSDKDVDYCELQIEFEGGPTIDRYVMLSRKRQFAVLADVLVGSPAKRLDLVSLLPLADGVNLEACEGTREQRLQSGRQTVRVYPLALPCDAGIGTVGRIGPDDLNGQSCLAVGQASETGGLFSPVIFDWSKSRRNVDVEWRPLTVTHAGEIDRTGAFAYRCLAGSQHLVLFRALESTSQYRTVLGYQPENETVVADFTNKGEFDPILLVE